jgi:hypothetical protein
MRFRQLNTNLKVFFFIISREPENPLMSHEIAVVTFELLHILFVIHTLFLIILTFFEDLLIFILNCFV